MAIANVHRLPQHTIFDEVCRKNSRPIIVKFSNVYEKYKFAKNLKNLKNYNEKRRSKNKLSLCLIVKCITSSYSLPKDDQKLIIFTQKINF